MRDTKDDMSLERADLRQIAKLIHPSSRVLDVGSGDGSLLYSLKTQKNVDGRGIEVRQNLVNASLARGLAVIQGDAEEELPEYPDKSFDYVVLTRTLPAARHPLELLRQILRIGKRVIISIPNFGYWKVRLHLLFHGTMPITQSLESSWYETENIHLCTIKDFRKLAKNINIFIESSFAIADNKVLSFSGDDFRTNLFSEEAIFVLYQ
ncbi:MAG: methionine biosynthesis protein MetW [Pseudomonadota bacterium]